MRKLILAGLVLGVAAYAKDDKAVAGPALADTAPMFALRDLNGKMVFLKDLVGERAPPRSKKNAIILDFFQTFCEPCKVELPLLLKVHKEWKDRGVELVMVDYGEEVEKIQAFVKERSLTNMVLTDRYATAANLYKVTALPRTYLIGGDGKVKYVHSGKSDSIDIDLAKILKTLVPATTTQVRGEMPVPEAQK